MPLATFVLVLGFSAGCTSESSRGSESVAQATPTEAQAHEADTPPVPLLAEGPATDLPPNELGEVMVLEYHRLGEPEGEFRRSAANFRADLQRLYDAGYRPITMRRLLAGDIDLPRGTSPVVFTIDDSSAGQFYFLENGEIDPNTMVGMWAEFQQANPEWKGGATWCILPGADYPSNFFGERPSSEAPRAEREATIRRKMDYLVQNGHEICNHTLYHARLDRAANDLQVQEWIGRGEDSLKVYLPADYDIVTFGLPLGMWPRNRTLAYAGTYKGAPYAYEAVLEVTGGPNPSPFDTDFDNLSVTRIIVAPGFLERQLEAYVRYPDRRYVSDGVPEVITVPAGREGEVAAERWPGFRISAVGEG